MSFVGAVRWPRRVCDDPALQTTRPEGDSLLKKSRHDGRTVSYPNLGRRCGESAYACGRQGGRRGNLLLLWHGEQTEYAALTLAVTTGEAEIAPYSAADFSQRRNTRNLRSGREARNTYRAFPQRGTAMFIRDNTVTERVLAFPSRLSCSYTLSRATVSPDSTTRKRPSRRYMPPLQ